MKNRLILLFLSLLVVGSVQAKLAGKNVVLVHGFQPGNLLDPPNVNQQISNANDYWSEYWGARAEATLYWSSTDRVTGAIKDTMQDQITALANAGTCAAGCVFVTHSTGDLVTRDILVRLKQWGISARQFRILAVLDFAGAGGGTELADIAVSIGEGVGLANRAQRGAMETFLGFDLGSNLLGVLYDLRPNTARSIATSNSVVPRMRFVGGGWQYLGITKPFISGTDDSVVPIHSACGAVSKGAYDSCSRSIRMDGVITSEDAPGSLWFNHYAILMGEDTNHSEAISNDRSGHFTTVANNINLGGLSVDFNTKTERKWWALWRKVRRVKNGDQKSMSANVYETLN